MSVSLAESVSMVDEVIAEANAVVVAGAPAWRAEITPDVGNVAVVSCEDCLVLQVNAGWLRQLCAWGGLGTLSDEIAHYYRLEALRRS